MLKIQLFVLQNPFDYKGNHLNVNCIEVKDRGYAFSLLPDNLLGIEIGKSQMIYAGMT